MGGDKTQDAFERESYRKMDGQEWTARRYEERNQEKHKAKIGRKQRCWSWESFQYPSLAYQKVPKACSVHEHTKQSMFPIPLSLSLHNFACIILRFMVI